MINDDNIDKNLNFMIISFDIYVKKIKLKIICNCKWLNKIYIDLIIIRKINQQERIYVKTKMNKLLYIMKSNWWYIFHITDVII